MLSLLIERAVHLRRVAYQRRLLPAAQLDIPVVSVGSLSMGGVGKTPVAALIAERLLDKGLAVALVSGGYRGTAGRLIGRVHAGQDGRYWGDEAVMLAGRLPRAIVIRGPDKLAAARLAQKEGAGVVVVDDGFQHLRLRRQLDIVLLDKAHHLPFLRAYRREGQRALGGHELCWLHQRGAEQPDTDKAAVISRYRASAIVDRRGSVVGDLAGLCGRRVAVMAGIARGEAFASTIRALGAQVVFCHLGADHQPFCRRRVRAALAAGPELLLCTEKDLARGAHLFGFVALRCDVELLRGRTVLARALEPICGC